MALTTTLSAGIGADQTGTLGLNTSAVIQMGGSYSVLLATGTGASLADKVYSGRRTLTASSTEDVDLAGGLTDAFGVAITFVKVKAIYIRALSTNTNNVVVGGAAAMQFVGGFLASTCTWAIPPDGLFLVTAPVSGWTVGAGSTDLLKIANSSSGTSVVYDLIVVGTSA